MMKRGQSRAGERGLAGARSWWGYREVKVETSNVPDLPKGYSRLEG